MSGSNRIRWAIGALALVVAAGIAAAVLWARRQATTMPPAAFPPAAAVATDTIHRADFRGSAACAECHAAQFVSWSMSTHGRAGEAPPADLPLLPFDGRTIRFRDATVEARTRGGALEFVVRWLGREDRYEVAGVVGAGHMIGGGTQGFLWRHPDGSLRLLPFEIEATDSTWFCATAAHTNRGWLPITDSLSLVDCNDFPPARVFGSSTRQANCQECHGSQIQLEPGTLPQETHFTSLAVNCESCHGPGARHVEVMRSGGPSSDIGMPVLSALSRDASVAVCMRCHALKSELREGFLPGRNFGDHYSLEFALLAGDPVHADGRTRTFAYQQGHLYSDCYLSGSMTCVDCHEPHGQQYRDINGRALIGRFDDRQCTACHESKSAQPGLHTHHAPESAGSRCTSCHMPFVQEAAVGSAVRYTRSDHTISIPRPELDRRLGIVNACQGCHVERGVDSLRSDVVRLWGELKPLRAITGALVERGDADDLAAVILAADTTHALAYFDALARYSARLQDADAGAMPGRVASRLWELSDSRNDDLAGFALAMLHFDDGTSARTRNRLADWLRAAGEREIRVRRRWAVALAHRGDEARDAGQHARAAAAYGKALELLPDDAELLHARGLALLNVGDARGASEALARAVAADPRSSLARLNHGRALGALGDRQAEVSAYRAALQVNPYDALGYLYLGNTLASAGERAQAAELYRRAVELDASLAAAHFNLARMLLFEGRRADALASIRRGLLFDPAHVEASQAARELEAELATPRSRSSPGS